MNKYSENINKGYAISKEKEKVTEIELIFRVVDERPYYEIKHKKVGESFYHVGYSSYCFENVLRWRDEYFEMVKQSMSNADKIRTMTDEELAEWLHNIEPFEKDEDYYISMAGEGEQEIYIRDSYGDILKWMKQGA